MTTIAPLLALLATLLLAPVAAQAHAQLRGSFPEAGAVVPQAPASVVLEFNEPVSPLVLTWIAPDGTELAVDARPQGLRLHVTAPENISNGTHLLSWRVVSLDGHPCAGTLVLSIGTIAEASGSVARLDASSTAWPAAAARLALTFALVGGVGAALFAAFVAHHPAELPRAMTLAVLPAAALAVGTQGLDLLGLAPPALLTTEPWTAAASAPIVLTAVLAALAALAARSVLVSGTFARGARKRAAAATAWLLAALSFAASGHAATASPRWIAAPAVLLHAIALIFWLGALLPLLSQSGYPRSRPRMASGAPSRSACRYREADNPAHSSDGLPADNPHRHDQHRPVTPDSASWLASRSPDVSFK